MSDQVGDKTEQPTPKKLEEAVKRGQFAKSVEVQTVFVLLAGLVALKMSGAEIWRQLVISQTSIFGHLHEISISAEALPNYSIRGALVLVSCVAPILVLVAVAGLLAGGLQNRFQTASEALTPNWGRLNPVEGLKRVFSLRSLVPTGLGCLKLLAVIGFSYSKVLSILSDATLYSAVSIAGIASFIAEAALSITWRIILSLTVLAAIDYAYQFWRTNRDLMMTRQEVKDEAKGSEGNPQVRARQRKRRTNTMRHMLLEIPKADVVVTNPTHLAVALRYDRKSMKAPRIIAKGSRLNALRIREIAKRHQIPIIENKPLARMMFKFGRVGGEVPAQLYLAVAEVLAYVYRMNRYRYYAQENQMPPAEAPAIGLNR